MVTRKLMRDAVIIQDGGWIGADIVLKQTIQTNKQTNRRVQV